LKPDATFTILGSEKLGKNVFKARTHHFLAHDWINEKEVVVRNSC